MSKPVGSAPPSRVLFHSKKDIKLQAGDSLLGRLTKLFKDLSEIIKRQSASITQQFASSANPLGGVPTHYEWGVGAEKDSEALKGLWDAFRVCVDEIPFITEQVKKVEAIGLAIFFFQQVSWAQEESHALKERLLARDFAEENQQHKMIVEACEQIVQNSESHEAKSAKLTVLLDRVKHGLENEELDHPVLQLLNDSLECLLRAFFKINPNNHLDDDDFVMVENEKVKEEPFTLVEKKKKPTAILREELKFPFKSGYYTQRKSIDRLEELATELQMKEEELQALLKRAYHCETVVIDAALTNELQKTTDIIISIKKWLSSLDEKSKAHGVAFYAGRLLNYAALVKKQLDLLQELTGNIYQTTLTKQDKIKAFLLQLPFPPGPRSLFEFVQPLAVPMPIADPPPKLCGPIQRFAEELFNTTIGEVGKMALRTPFNEEPLLKWLENGEPGSAPPDWFLGELERQLVEWLYFSDEPSTQLLLILRKMMAFPQIYKGLGKTTITLLEEFEKVTGALPFSAGELNSDEEKQNFQKVLNIHSQIQQLRTQWSARLPIAQKILELLPFIPQEKIEENMIFPVLRDLFLNFYSFIPDEFMKKCPFEVLKALEAVRIQKAQ